MKTLLGCESHFQQNHNINSGPTLFVSVSFALNQPLFLSFFSLPPPPAHLLINPLRQIQSIQHRRSGVRDIGAGPVRWRPQRGVLVVPAVELPFAALAGRGRGGPFRVQLPVVLLLVAVHPAHLPPLFAHQHVRGGTRVVLALQDVRRHRGVLHFRFMGG